MENKKLISHDLYQIIIISFLLNFVWEILHSSLYVCNLPACNFFPSVANNMFWLTIASVIDAFSVGIIFLTNSYLKKEIRFGLKWTKNPKRVDYVFIMFLGILIAIIYEMAAIKVLNLWQYSESMPVIFSMGLTPLLQLAATSAITLFLVSKIKKTFVDSVYTRIKKEFPLFIKTYRKRDCIKPAKPESLKDP